MILLLPSFFFFFFNDTATTEIYTLSLHDALPIYIMKADPLDLGSGVGDEQRASGFEDRKSTRLNSSHSQISYAVFCLKKKKKPNTHSHTLKADASQYHEISPTADEHHALRLTSPA